MSEQPRRRGEVKYQVGNVAERSLALPLHPDPHMPSPYDLRDLVAFRALRAGHADSQQQARVLEWLIQICGTYENPYRPGGRGAERASQFASGKQFIGQQIVKLLNMPIAGAENSEQGEQG